MNLNRGIVVPITAAVMFGLGYGLSALIGLFWHTMPPLVRWGIPVALVIWYLIDAMARERGPK
jgi:hypothetical protein